MLAKAKTAREFVLRHGQWFVIALAAAIRFINLGFPNRLVFDETYYVKDARTLSQLGYESTWPPNFDRKFATGSIDSFNTDPSFVVHPPLGKWLIALGENLFVAQNAFSWRFTVALAGVLGVWLVIVIARRLLHSAGWALIAGLFMAIDGMAIVMSRTAILDNFVMLFALLAFYCLLRDRDRTATILMRRAEGADGAEGAETSWNGVVWNRPWLLATAVALGLTTAIKWSGIYFAIFFGAYIVFSEVLTRRRLGYKRWAVDGFVGQGFANLLLMVPIYLGVYLSTWAGWILTRGGWSRTWAQNPDNQLGGLLDFLPNWLRSLIHYHEEIYGFHVNLHTPHNYQSQAYTWLFNIRPVSFFYEGADAGDKWCDSNTNCSMAITALGNPLIWWGAAAAVILVLLRYLAGIADYTDPRGRYFRKPLGEDHRTMGLLLLGVVAGWLPWFLYPQRTVFQFYAIAFLPYTILCLTYALKLVSETGGARLSSRAGQIEAHGGETEEEAAADFASAQQTQRRWHSGVKLFVILSVAFSIFYSNIWLGYETPYWYWLLHMWLPSWI